MSSRDAMEYLEEAHGYLTQAIKAVETESLDEAISLFNRGCAIMFTLKHYVNIFVLFLLYSTIGEATLYGIPATEYKSDLMGHTIKWAAETEKPHRTIYVKIKNPLSAKSMLLNYGLIEEYAKESGRRNVI